MAHLQEAAVKKINEILYDLRTDHDLSQDDLAKKLGTTQRRISYLEKGTTEPNTDDIRKYCRYFKVSADFILGLNQSEE